MVKVTKNERKKTSDYHDAILFALILSYCKHFKLRNLNKLEKQMRLSVKNVLWFQKRKISHKNLPAKLTKTTVGMNLCIQIIDNP